MTVQSREYHQNPTWIIGVTYRSRSDTKTDASPNLTPAWVTAHGLGTWSTPHNLQPAQPVAASVGLRVLFAHWFLLFTPNRQEPDESVQFQGLWVWGCYILSETLDSPF